MKYLFIISLLCIGAYFILRKETPMSSETYEEELSCLKELCTNWQETEDYNEVLKSFSSKVDYWADTLKLKHGRILRDRDKKSKYVIFNSEKNRAVFLTYQYDPQEDRLYGTTEYIPAENKDGVWYFFFIWGHIPMMAYHKAPADTAPPLSFIIDRTLLYSIKSGLILKDSCEINEAYFNEAFFPDNRWELLEKFEKGEYPNQ